ncbi:hypothetical protein RMATCC62417_13229 [Rhizopus microsporus]|nr:hypothetical protein RMATCC62417_13229 [Rhizopus microsporus]
MYKPKLPLLKNNYGSLLNSLTQCRKCSSPFNKPTTLSCGFTLCHDCIPHTPFQCMSFTCLRAHQNEHQNRPTVLLEEVITHYQQKSLSRSLFNCSICLSTLHDPVTTQCGHTFCKTCLIMLQNRSCPICRTILGRLGKVDQCLSNWLSFISSTAPTSASIQPDHSLLVIQLNTPSTILPTQQCLFHISIPKKSIDILNYMCSHPDKTHYALCLSAISKDTHGTIIQIKHIDILHDLGRSVIQAVGLFCVSVNQLSFDALNHCYSGNITKLDRKHSFPAVKIELQNRKMATPVLKPRSRSMQLFKTSPTFKPVDSYLPFIRPAWGSPKSTLMSACLRNATKE